MKINVSEIPQGDSTLEFVEAPASLDLGGLSAEFTSDIPVSLRIHRRENEIVILGTVTGTVSEECSRCLEAVERKFSVEFEVFCDKIGARGGERQGEEKGSETFVVLHDGKTLELGPCVREAVVLSLPIKPLCSEDCKGLCPVCGTNLNDSSCECDRSSVDPRWSVLEKLKKREEE
jgi:uncharacterized protein